MRKATETEIKKFCQYRANHVALVQRIGRVVFDMDFSDHDNDKIEADGEKLNLLALRNAMLNGDYHPQNEDKKQLDLLVGNHVCSQPHHPEYYCSEITPKNFDDKNPPQCRPSRMPDKRIIEMACDWAAVALKRNQPLFKWVNKVCTGTNARFIFTSHQKKLLIDSTQKIIDAIKPEHLAYPGVNYTAEQIEPAEELLESFKAEKSLLLKSFKEKLEEINAEAKNIHYTSMKGLIGILQSGYLEGQAFYGTKSYSFLRPSKEICTIRSSARNSIEKNDADLISASIDNVKISLFTDRILSSVSGARLAPISEYTKAFLNSARALAKEIYEEFNIRVPESIHPVIKSPVPEDDKRRQLFGVTVKIKSSLSGKDFLESSDFKPNLKLLQNNEKYGNSPELLFLSKFQKWLCNMETVEELQISNRGREGEERFILPKNSPGIPADPKYMKIEFLEMPEDLADYLDGNTEYLAVSIEELLKLLENPVMVRNENYKLLIDILEKRKMQENNKGINWISNFKESILDIPQKEYSSVVLTPEDTLKPEVRKQILLTIKKWKSQIDIPFKVLKVEAKGSLLSKRYTETSDLDVSIYTDLPLNVRDDLIDIVPRGQNILVNGEESTHPLDLYILASGEKTPERNLDNIYDVLNNKWIKRTEEYENELPLDYVMQVCNFMVNGCEISISNFNQDKTIFEQYSSANPETQDISEEEREEALSSIKEDLKADLDGMRIALHLISSFRHEAYDATSSPFKISIEVKNDNPHVTINEQLSKWIEQIGIKQRLKVAIDECEKLVEKGA